MKKNFQCDDKVYIHSTTSEELDNQGGVILGKSHVHITDTYIILLDKPVIYQSAYDDQPYTHKAICLTEACIDKCE